jgi:hypothetical protein
MRKLATVLGGFIGSSIGWWLGSSFGIMTAFILSTIGTGFGIYAGIRLIQRME